MNKRSLQLTIPSRSLLAACALLFFSVSLSARTITLTAEDCEQMAVISEQAPRLSWAPIQMSPGVYTNHQLQWHPHMTVLIRFPIEQIPKGQNITKAELTMPTEYIGGGKPQVNVHRILTEWGAGVCHQYRLVYPKKVEWDKPGCRGVASDRANKVSAVFRIDKVGDQTVDVTGDVELWYTAAVPNRGWILNLEEGGIIYAPTLHPRGIRWKLQITYEPK
jgi:hypothetical protein